MLDVNYSVGVMCLMIEHFQLGGIEIGRHQKDLVIHLTFKVYSGTIMWVDIFQNVS